MTIDVINTAQEVTDEKVLNKTIVIIDVLRATSVMVTAIQNGAQQIIPVLSPEEAFEAKKTIGHDVVLGGERNADLIEGFDYGNSPLSYTPEVIKDKSLVMTTSNGTLALRNSIKAAKLFIGCFLNAQAAANILNSYDDIVLVCSGTNGNYTLEDNLCAGYIISLIDCEEKSLSDSAIASLHLYNSTKENVKSLASKGLHYNILKQKQYNNDLNECFTMNKYNIVPLWNGKSIIKAVPVSYNSSSAKK